jgi:hypothetical protein
VRQTVDQFGFDGIAETIAPIVGMPVELRRQRVSNR